jgi:CRP/FNR family transcriptional regulator, cyclic AMP receptor protein
VFKTRDKKIEVLQRVPLFSACSRRELERIASLADHEELPSGTVLTHEGRVGNEAFIIARGQAEARIGKKKVAVLGPGQMVGEMALIDRGPRSATVTAVTDVDVLVLDPRSFASLMDDVPSVARKVLKTIVQRLRDAEKAPTH